MNPLVSEQRSDQAVRYPFGGRQVVVTGGRSGIGLATVQLLAASGLEVIALDLTEPDSVSSAGVTQVRADVTDEAAVRAAIEPLALDTGLAYLVNCAGIHQQVSLAEITQAQWQRMLDINLIAPATVSRALLPWLQRSTTPAIVNVASLESTAIVALVNPEPVPHYAASKAALQMLTRTMARDYARLGIRVNSVAPGFVVTPMSTANHRVAASTSEASSDAAMSLPPAAAARVPMGRYASAAEIAGVIAFLLSDGASYMTGSSVPVDGGFLTT
ncbi:MAG: SDR family NAD(P)-dependent oxidoreductase [Actinomycetales bacterium]